MKIITSIYNLEQLNKWKNYLDAALLAMPGFSLVNEKNFDIDKAIDLCNLNNILPVLAMNKMIHPAEEIAVLAIVKKYKDLNCYFYFTDLGAANIAKKEGIISRVIFDPQTMITNFLDAQEYYSIGFDSIAMSSEIPFQDVIDTIDKNNISIFYQIFGHRIMFHSKRMLLSLYAEKAGIKVPTRELHLKEATREELLPIIENENGTIIYRSYQLSLLNQFSNLEKLSYGFLESKWIDEDVFSKVLEVYYLIKNSNLSYEEGIKILNGLPLDIQDGFTFQDSVYQKETFK